mmetsp:Transcript_16185/g.27379  ORF Transcript_16185/g.27379 Transcript_16185/m.27379 type:complete len:81 (+) Transcript_16185:449-691(+)
MGKSQMKKTGSGIGNGLFGRESGFKTTAQKILDKSNRLEGYKHQSFVSGLDSQTPNKGVESQGQPSLGKNQSGNQPSGFQ